MAARFGRSESWDSSSSFGGQIDQEESLVEARIVKLRSLAEDLADQFVGQAEFLKSRGCMR